MRVLGLDIGGANIKSSDADGVTRSLAFPMWSEHTQLSATLQEMFRDCVPPDLVGLTMTAELADCFSSKEQGVRFIVSAVEEAFPAIPVRIWMTSGEFAEPTDAVELAPLVAASNWHALATWFGRSVPDGPAILIDIGSTTTDIIPLLDGYPVPGGLNDSERLQSGELVYTGSYRTPICAISSSVTLNGIEHPLAAEFFATIADALVVMKLLPENDSRTDTADGRSLTLANSRQRLARMLCRDSCELSETEFTDIATQIFAKQQQQLSDALRNVVCRLQSEMEAQMRSLSCESISILLSGSGSFLTETLLKNIDDLNVDSTLSLSAMSRPEIAESACAFAVARLAQERCRDDVIPETHIPVVGWPDNGIETPSTGPTS